MKPDWKEAPEWANYLAMDEDGNWYWHKTMPTRKRSEWYSSTFATADKYLNWSESLEQRP